jgi:hypothetical protein
MASTALGWHVSLREVLAQYEAKKRWGERDRQHETVTEHDCECTAEEIKTAKHCLLHFQRATMLWHEKKNTSEWDIAERCTAALPHLGKGGREKTSPGWRGQELRRR